MPPTRSAPQGAAPRRTAANSGATPAPPTSSTTLSAGSQPAPVLVASGSVPSRTTEVQTTASTSHAYRPSPLDSLLAEQGLTRYHLEPPAWRAPWLRESRTPTPEPGVKPLASRTPLIRLAGAPVVPGVAGAAGGGRNGADASADKGRTKPWPVFYPPRDGMDEDQMTEAIVKSGFSAKSAETFSAHQHIYDKLKTTDVLGNLSRLVAAVQAKAESHLPTYGPSTFRLPSRITLTDAKREAWFTELASPAVPLSKLSRSVPHGYKGEKGLDMLAHRQVETGRAVWFVRAFGGIEIQSLAKTRPITAAISLYTTEFTTVVCEFVRKQLAEVVLPSSGPSASLGAATPAPPSSNPTTPTALAQTPRARSGSLGMAAQQQAQAAKAAAALAQAGGGLMDEDKRKAWEGKFEYTVRLVESLYHEALLDRPQFLRFLISLLDTPASATAVDAVAALGQLSFVLLLVEEYFADVLASEPCTARMVKAGVIRLQQLDAAPPSTLRTTVMSTLESMIRSAFLANPDAFVSLLPTPIYPLSTRSTSPARPSSTSLGRAPLDPAATRLKKLLLDTGKEQTGSAPIDDEDHEILGETIAADLRELEARRQIAQPSSLPSSGASKDSSVSDLAIIDDQVLLAAIERLDEIEFPLRMKDVHRSIFVDSSSKPPSPVLGATATANGGSSTGSPAKPRPTTPSSSSSASSSSPTLPLASALPLLFTWSTTPSRPLPAPHRRYAVSRLIALELERLSLDSDARKRVTRSNSSASSASPLPSVEDAFVRWVDERFPTRSPASSAATSSDPTALVASAPGPASISRDDVRALAEELLRAGVMSYGAYLQRLIARGETEPRPSSASTSSDSPPESVHLWILRTVALATPSSGGASAGPKRRVALAGDEGVARALRLEALQRTVAHELEIWVFANALPADGGSCDALLQAVGELRDEGAHWVVTRERLPEGLSARIDAASGRIELEVEQMAVICAVYERTGDWWGLLQLLIVILRLSPPLPLLLHIVDIVEGHLDIATALDALSEVGAALCAAHEAHKNTGASSDRRLLTLLRRLGNAGLLHSSAKEIIEADCRSLAASLTATKPQTQAIPVPLTEVQTLLVDSSPAAVAQLASTIWFRYHAHPSWSTIALESVMQLVPQLPPHSPSVIEPSPAAGLLRALHERLPLGLEPVLARWTAAMTPQQLSATFGGADGSARTAMLSELVVDGVVGPLTMLKGVLLPLRRALLSQLIPLAAERSAAAGSGATQLVSSVDTAAIMQALQNAHAVLSVVIFSAPATSDPAVAARDSTPAKLVAQQRLDARRASLGTRAALVPVGSALALHIVQQDVATTLGFSELAESTGELFLRFATLPELQSLVVRNPDGMRDTMLDGDIVKSLPGIDTFRPKLLAGVLLLLKDGGSATPANLVSTEDWDTFLSCLTLWRLSISKVEVEACLERLELDPAISASDKADALHTLSQHFVERVCTGEGQSYLGEQVVRCYHGSASDELVSVAFGRLADAVTALKPSAVSPEDDAVARTTLRCACRLLDTLLQTGTAASSTASLNRLLEAVKACLVSARLAADEADLASEQQQELVLYLAHLVAVALRCSAKPAEKSTAELYRDCLIPFAKLASTLAKGRAQDCELSTLLLDTCSHILFALPDLNILVRAPTLQNLLVHQASLPPHVMNFTTDSTFTRLTHLFGPYAPSSLVANPWELLDNADPSSSTAVGGVRKAASQAPQQLANMGPIDLAAFRARIVETIPAVTALDAVSTASNGSTSTNATLGAGFERGVQTNFDFETPCTGLSVAARDHRRTLAISRALSSRVENGVTPSAAAQAQAQQGSRKRSATGESKQVATPAPPPVAASSTSGAAANRGAKRKSTAEVVLIDSDDEAPSKSKKSKGSSSAATGKTAGKTTASKTTASKTTVGKSSGSKRKK
ncbi:hypothetical protein Rhopal_004114-T1 [Rhodotorula paludigena]|uniref:Mediator of RNA polymerase II transcription subunit 12 n=1 Tax=Rhodotorula paludigena TaxID=86838 RepID=A0AAV5GNM1_9BASI|nr:hypothetical protein Rhopal_004114-T1 [Rhodotorula paludigena]